MHEMGNECGSGSEHAISRHTTKPPTPGRAPSSIEKRFRGVLTAYEVMERKPSCGDAKPRSVLLGVDRGRGVGGCGWYRRQLFDSDEARRNEWSQLIEGHYSIQAISPEVVTRRRCASAAARLTVFL